MRPLLVLATLVACGTPSVEDDVAGDGPVIDPAAFEGAPVRAVSDGACPDLSTSGMKTFSSGGRSRDVIVHLPKEVGPGLPVVFFWHGLGDSATSMSGWMGLEQVARQHDAILVVPDSQDRSGSTWDILGGGGDDLVLFDDLRACLSRQLEVDLARITTTGFSFGGLWTSWLTIHRSRAFAATMPMSGGTDPFFVRYDTPKHTMPVLLMWGGEDDTFGSGSSTVEFEATTLDFSERLRADGHFVVHCEHDLGHWVPPDAASTAATWLTAHTFGEASPFADALGVLSDGCVVP